jgi:hypothetical protein
MTSFLTAALRFLRPPDASSPAAPLGSCAAAAGASSSFAMLTALEEGARVCADVADADATQPLRPAPRLGAAAAPAAAEGSVLCAEEARRETRQRIVRPGRGGKGHAERGGLER